jgi:hypothetical protein
MIGIKRSFCPSKDSEVVTIKKRKINVIKFEQIKIQTQLITDPYSNPITNTNKPLVKNVKPNNEIDDLTKKFDNIEIKNTIMNDLCFQRKNSNLINVKIKQKIKENKKTDQGKQSKVYFADLIKERNQKKTKGIIYINNEILILFLMLI